MAARTVTKVTYVDNETVIGASNLNAMQDAINDHASLIDGLDTNKVSKVAGKGLSTNDFTNDAQSKLSGLPTGTDLDTTLETKVDKRTSGTEVYMHNATTQGGATLTETPTAGAVPLYGTGGVLKAAAPVESNDVVRKAELDEVKDNINAVSVTNTVSGAIASFSDGADNVPVKSLVVNIEPVQEGSGDPSPDNIRPISGWTGAEIEGCGKNLLTGTTRTSSIHNGITFTYNADGSVTMNGTASATAMSQNLIRYRLKPGEYIKNPLQNHIFTYAQYVKDEASWSVFPGGNGSSNVFTVTEETAKYDVRFRIAVDAGTTLDNYTFYPYCYVDDETDLTWEPYTGSQISVTFPSSAGTVYGGTLTINQDRTGSLVVDRAMVKLANQQLRQRNTETEGIYRFTFNPSPGVKYGYFTASNVVTFSNVLIGATAYKSYSAPRIEYCVTSDANGNNINVFASELQTVSDWITFATANDVEILYELATPITYTLTASEIDGILTTIYGTNNIWADCGDTSVTYAADTKLYIEHLTQPTEDDMTADHAIASGTFFMIGNTLYLATSQIAAGGTITPGTNATQLSLADALNQLNA